MKKITTIEAATGNWDKIFSFYKLPPITGKKHFKGKCPICKQKGKFRIDDRCGQGTYICTCGAGNGFKLLELTQGKNFKNLAAEIDKLLGITTSKSKLKTQDNRIFQLRTNIINNYANLVSLKETLASQYLQNRGIFILPKDNVKYCANQPVKGNKKLQAIWSLVTDAKGNLCYLHRSFLDGTQKANIIPQKKLDSLQEQNYLDHAESIAIRLFPVSSTLGIAEGIETALSCKQIYNVNTWSVVNTQFMKKFKVPLGVKNLIIFADMDWHAAGLSAATFCANKNLLANNDLEKVSIRWPDNGDFNDVLQAGCEVRELVFMRKDR